MFDLKAFRKANKLKQSEVADIICCNQSYISMVEQQNAQLSDLMISRLTSVYGIEEIQKYFSDDIPEVNKTQTNEKSLDPEMPEQPKQVGNQDLIEIIKEQSRQLTTSQNQIDKLIQLLENSNAQVQKLVDALTSK